MKKSKCNNFSKCGNYQSYTALGLCPKCYRDKKGYATKAYQIARRINKEARIRKAMEKENMSEEEIVMPWGQHKGRRLHTLSSHYLKWLAENCEWDDKIMLAADEEYQWRERNNEHKDD